MIDEILNSLLNLNAENEVVEFMEAKIQYSKDKLGQYFSALSNEANLKGVDKAWFVMGVNNNRIVVGTSITDNLINEFKAEMGMHTSPRNGFVDVHKVQKNGKVILMFEIPPAPKGMPMCWKGHRYGRDGESLVALHDSDYDAIKAQAHHSDWSAQLIEDTSIGDLSEEAISFARAQFKEKNPKLGDEIDNWSDAIFLDKAKITVKGRITHTAILLLGKPESDYLINPASARITWILKDVNNLEKDYEHFSSPLLLSVKEVRAKIRNLKYRYLRAGTLFPDEVDQYDPYIIREALNNCIAHQDYTLGGKIIVVENDGGVVSFTNSGNFIPASVEEVVTSESPEPVYRNTFLVNAMVNLNMIDTIGSGIKRMFSIQRQKFFPLPEYDLSHQKVIVTFIGKIIDPNYAHILAEMPDLSLSAIILLDKVAKKKPITDEEVKVLKNNNLIEGRKPNFYISSRIASVTGDKADYMKQRGIDDNYCQKMILEYLEKFGEAKRKDFEKILIGKLPDILDIEQKKNKIKNNLQRLKKQHRIEPYGKAWRMSKQQ